MNALLIIEVSKLLKGLLDLLTKSLRLTESGEKKDKTFPRVEPKLVHSQEMHNRKVTGRVTTADLI